MAQVFVLVAAVMLGTFAVQHKIRPLKQPPVLCGLIKPEPMATGTMSICELSSLVREETATATQDAKVQDSLDRPALLVSVVALTVIGGATMLLVYLLSLLYNWLALRTLRLGIRYPYAASLWASFLICLGYVTSVFVIVALVLTGIMPVLGVPLRVALVLKLGAGIGIPTAVLSLIPLGRRYVENFGSRRRLVAEQREWRRYSYSWRQFENGGRYDIRDVLLTSTILAGQARVIIERLDTLTEELVEARASMITQVDQRAAMSKEPPGHSPFSIWWASRPWKRR
jgi:hypothetical protein